MRPSQVQKSSVLPIVPITASYTEHMAFALSNGKYVVIVTPEFSKHLSKCSIGNDRNAGPLMNNKKDRHPKCSLVKGRRGRSFIGAVQAIYRNLVLKYPDRRNGKVQLAPQSDRIQVTQSMVFFCARPLNLADTYILRSGVKCENRRLLVYQRF